MRAPVRALVLLLIACGGGDVATDTDDTAPAVDTDTDTDTTTGGDTDVPVPAAPCKLTGTWSLVAVKCGNAHITEDYKAVYIDTELRITEAEGGGCAIEATIASATCEQQEEWYTDDGFGANAVIERRGVTRCDPTGCKFSPKHQKSCSPGANVLTETVEIYDVIPKHLLFRGLLQDLVPQCGGELSMAFGSG